MKKVVLFAFTAIVLAGCNHENEVLSKVGNTELATVQFEFKTPGYNQKVFSKALSSSYDTKYFRLLAFRDNTENFFYTGDVSMEHMKFDDNRKTFTGTAQLPVGNYKFIPVYGLPVDNESVALPTLSPATIMNNALTISHQSNGVLPAIFLRNDANIPVYSLGLNSNSINQVSETIKRAVSRVDLLFIRADKQPDGTFKERTGSNIFGENGIGAIRMFIEKINSTVRLIDGGAVDNSETINSLFNVKVNDAITLGTHDVKTTLGDNINNVPYDFENIKPQDIIAGSAHVYGPFLFPFENEVSTTKLNIHLTSDPDANHNIYEREIAVPAIPLLRNRVTLVKIYVTGEDVFHTNVSFDISIIDAWEDPVVKEIEVS